MVRVFVIISAVIFIVIAASMFAFNRYYDGTYEPRRSLTTPNAEKLLPLSCAIVVPDGLRKGKTSISRIVNDPAAQANETAPKGLNGYGYLLFKLARRFTSHEHVLHRSLGELVATALEDSARKVFRDVRVVPSVEAISGRTDVIIEVTGLDIPETEANRMEIKNARFFEQVETGMSAVLHVRITRNANPAETYTATEQATCNHGSIASPLDAIDLLMTRQAEETARMVSNNILDKAIPEGMEKPKRDIASVVIGLAKSDSALDSGRRLYSKHCSECHGGDAQGTEGNPNLTDGDWLAVNGDSPEQIRNIILQGRNDMCLPAKDFYSYDDVRRLTEYLLTLSRQGANQHEAGPAGELSGRSGEELFKTRPCGACHGQDGKGNLELGAPNLTDDIWLNAHDPDSIREGILNGRIANMPGFSCRLSDDEADLLTAYVYSLTHH